MGCGPGCAHDIMAYMYCWAVVNRYNSMTLCKPVCDGKLVVGKLVPASPYVEPSRGSQQATAFE